MSEFTPDMMIDVYVRRVAITWHGDGGHRIDAAQWLFKWVRMPGVILRPGLIINDGGEIILTVEDVAWSVPDQRVEATLEADVVSFRIPNPTQSDLQRVIDQHVSQLISEGWAIEPR